MGTSKSKPTVESKNGDPKDTERIQELEHRIFKLQALLGKFVIAMDRLHELQQGKLNQVQETESDYRQELLKQLQEAEVMIKKLEDDKMRLKLEKMAVEVSKARLEEELQLKIDTLNVELQNAYKKYLQHLQEKGELCDKDCVLCSLLWICHEKLGIYPCGRHLEKIITSETQREHGITYREELCCGNFMYMLKKCGIIDDAENIKTYIIPDDINKAWKELMDIDTKNLVVMVGRRFSKHLGHCVVCDLETRNQKDGLLTYHDLQQDESKTGNIKDFRNLVSRDKDIKLYTVNFTKLQEIIDKHRDILHITYSKSNITKPIDTNNTTRVTELVHCTDRGATCDNNRAVSSDDRTASDDERAASHTDRAVRNHDRTGSDEERAASDTDRAVSNDDKRAASDTDRAVSDDERVVSNTNRGVSDTDRAASDIDSAVSDDKRAACDNERIASDTDRAVSYAKRAAISDDRAASNDNLAGSENNRAGGSGELVAYDTERTASDAKRVAYDAERAVTDAKRAASSDDRAARYADLAGSEDNRDACDVERVACHTERAASDAKNAASAYDERASSDVKRAVSDVERVFIGSEPSTLEQLYLAFTEDDKST